MKSTVVFHSWSRSRPKSKPTSNEPHALVRASSNVHSRAGLFTRTPTTIQPTGYSHDFDHQPSRTALPTVPPRSKNAYVDRECCLTMQRRLELLVWYHELEEKIVLSVHEASYKVCDHVHHAELRLENGGIYVIVERRPTEKD